MDVVSAYDDAISARRLRARVAAACREHGAALPESAEDMAAVVENHPYFTSSNLPESQSIGRWTSTRCSGRRSRTQLPASYVRRLPASYVRRLNPKPKGDASTPG